MVDTKTSLETAATALDGTEIIRGVQAGGNVKLTVNQIATKVLAGAVSSVNTRTGAVALTATDVGLSLVNNTADASKPVSAAQAAADSAVATNASTALTAHTSNIANPHAVTPSQIGLGNLDNTSDIAKPVSTAQQTALNSKAPLASPTFSGVVGLPAGQSVNGVTLSVAAGTSAFLRGDGSYAAPSGGGDMLLAGTQTITGAKTFNAGALLLNNIANTFASLFTNTNTAARTYTLKDASGTVAFTSDITGVNSGTNTGDQVNIAGNAATVTTNANLTGDVISVGNATTLTNAPVIAKVLTGFVSGAGVVAATDSILAAIQKVNGNDAAKAPLASPTFTGVVTLPAGQVVNGVTLTAAGLATNYLTAAGTYAAVAGGGTPGGATTQLQYNNAGAFAGMSGTAWDDTNRSLVVTGATVTANKPLLDLAQTWNNGAVTFTGIKANITNTASSNASLLIDLQAGGATKFSVNSTGSIANAGDFYFGSAVGYKAFIGGGSSPFAGFTTTSNGLFGFVNQTTAAYNFLAIDVAFGRNAGGLAEVNNGTAGVFRDLKLRNLIVDNVVNLKVFTVATLPSAATSGAGAQAYVTDALTPAYNTAVTGGGAVKITVTADGTNWKT